MDRLGGGLRAVVGADVVRWATIREQLRQQMENVVGPDPTGDQDGEALPGIFVDEGKHPEGPAIVCPGQDEVLGPDVVRPARPQTDAGPVVEPKPASLGLLYRNLQPFAPPYSFHPLVVDVPALGPEQRRDAAIAVRDHIHRPAARWPR